MSFYELNQELTERLNNKFNETTKKLTEKGAEILSPQDMVQQEGEIKGKIKGKVFNVKYQNKEGIIFVGIDENDNTHYKILKDGNEETFKKLIDEIIK